MLATLSLIALAATPHVGDVVAADPAISGSRPAYRPRLAIVALSASGVPEAYAVGLTETIATHIQKTGVFETISPGQIASLLAYEKRRDVFGDCADEDCYAQLARVVRAEHLVAGSVAQVGERAVLNLVLIDAAEGTAIQRTKKEGKSASDLMSSARRASIALLQPILQRRRGYLRVSSNVPDAEVVVDEEIRREGVGQVIALSAGPHVVKIKRDGFYAATTEISIVPERVHAEKFTLIPAKETIDSYESKANFMRITAYVAGALAIGAGVTSGVFYARATDDKRTVDSFTSALAVEQAVPGRRSEALAARDSFQANQTVYLVGLGTALVSGAASLWLLLAGDDPDRYDEFESLQ